MLVAIATTWRPARRRSSRPRAPTSWSTGSASRCGASVSDRLGRVRTMRLTLLLAGLLSLVSAPEPDGLVLGIARGLAGGFFGAAYPSALIYLGDTVAGGGPAARHRAADGRRRRRHRARLGRGRPARRRRLVAAGVRPHRRRRARAGRGCSRRLPEPERDRRPRASALDPLRRIARSRVALLVLLFAFVEGAVLLGGLTLLPPAVENAGAIGAVAGAVTGVYGIVGVRRVARWSAGSRCAWHPARLILLGGALRGRSPAPAARRLPGAGGGRRRRRAARARPGRPMHSSLQTWATEVLPGARATVVSLFAGSLFVGSAPAAVAGGRPRRRRPLLAHLRRVRRARRAPRARRRGRPGNAGGDRSRTGGDPRMPPVQTPTLRDVAEAAGVHPATASRALNPATRGLVNAETARRVIKVAESLGYRPNPIARGLKTAKSGTDRAGHPRPDQPAVPADRARHRGRARAGRLQRPDRQHRQRPAARAGPDRARCAPARSRA